MNKVKILSQAIIGNLCKIRVWFHLWLNIKPKRSEKVAENVIVSLTSYGRRVSKCAPYTVFSMIVQTVRPEKIILWLDKEKWNDRNLPFALKRMQNWGMMEMEYCKDVRSFTKLVPALEKYPNKSIVTVDDDIYYSSNLIQFMHQESQHSHNNIIAYRQATYSYEAEQKFTLPLGTGGILYPPQSLHENVFDTQLSIELCSSLDDLWFYVMSLLKKTNISFLSESLVTYYYTDLFYQKFHKGSRLYDIVSINNKKVLGDILNFFHIINKGK